MISGKDDTCDTLLNIYIYMWYSVLNKMLLKLISPISFPSFEVDTKKF